MSRLNLRKEILQKVIHLHMTLLVFKQNHFFQHGVFQGGQSDFLSETVIIKNTLKIKISNKYIFFALNFPLLTFNFQTCKSKKTN